jgi:hypothetical protein
LGLQNLGLVGLCRVFGVVGCNASESLFVQTERRGRLFSKDSGLEKGLNLIRVLAIEGIDAC